MKRRITIWALVGFGVACGWAIVFFAVRPPLGSWNRGPLWALAELTCPVAILGRFMPLSVYAAIVLNAVTYGVLGLVVETLRQTLARTPKAT